jgi:putative RecB family exonuclease
MEAPMVAEPVAPPTLAELRKAPHVSYSQIKAFLLCPMKFFHAYTAKTEPSHRPLALVLGSAIHEALAAYYTCLMTTGGKIDEGELLSVFRDRVDREWDAPIPLRLDEGLDAGELLDQGIGLLRVFHEKAGTPRVLAVEQPFAVPLFDPATGEVYHAPLIGGIDLILAGEDRPLVVEHKTSAKRYAAWQLEFETQPSVYAYAAQEIGFGQADLAFQILVKTRTPSVQLCPIERTDRHVNEMMTTFSAALRAIQAGIFFKNRSWACADCQFRYRCDGD